MSAARESHYQILGLTETATQDDIKRRYRELARRYHPDVSPSPDAASKFKAINEAHRVLSDAERRRDYDAELRMARESRGTFVPRSTPASAPPSASASQNSAPPKNAATSKNTSARPNSSTNGTKTASNNSNAEVAQLIAAAQQAMRFLKYREAESLCRQALKRDRRSAQAWEILGDMQKARGHTDEAIAMYSYALQLDRNNRSLQLKFDRLLGKPSQPTFSENASRRANRGSASDATGMRFWFNALGFGVLAFLVFMIGVENKPAATTAFVYDWDLRLLFALAAAGMMGGLLLSINRLLMPVRGEMANIHSPRNRRNFVPLGAILIGFSLLSAYASFVIYILIAATQGTMSKSLLRAFLASFCLVAVFSLVSQTGAGLVLLWGGNVIFLTMLLGWAVGDAFRAGR